MSKDRYRFKLGDFECLAVRDVQGGNVDPGWFPNIPAEVSQSLLEKFHGSPDSFPNAMTCLAVNTGTDWVLLDTGMGFADEESKLAQILKEEDIQPDHIIITHLDRDHWAGLIKSDKTLAFPNAKVYVCRDEWDAFISNDGEAFYQDSEHRLRENRKLLLLIGEQVVTVDCDGKVLPGFTLIPFPGHRTHHVGIEVESNGEKLLFEADTVCHPLQIEHVDWQFVGDTDHDIARESHIKLAKIAADSGCLVLGFHFEFPGLGHVIQNGDGWKWQPLDI
ncbi:MAG TPA: MBL fold metallo-hydrolase [Anaerolineales bacterium]|nr:MBL fold metallo-hydrolase [Anaerolineales bacterium]